MKRKTKTQKLDDQFTAYSCMKNKQPVKRSRAKNGSIIVRPFLSIVDIPEKEVLKQCLNWLRKHKIVANRLNTGGGELGTSGYKTYGIVGGGDIIAILPNGKHLEVETKRGKGGRLSLNQQKRMNNVRNSDGFYFVVCSVDELAYYVRPIL